MMHVTWLVSDARKFANDPGPTSASDLILESGLTWKEWLELFFVVLGVEPEQLVQAKETNMLISQFDEIIPEYPMLSRISGVYRDAVFENDEVQVLEDECKQLLPVVTNTLARSALQKLLGITEEAKKRQLSIFLMCE